MYPGAYSASPGFPAQGQTAVIAFSARASVASGAEVSLICLDSSGANVGEIDVAVDAGATFLSGGGAITMPATTTAVQARVALLTPNATLDIQTISLFALP
jgi:hypothetical protein